MNRVELISVLGQQRSIIKSELESPGWNKWALVVGIASLFWIYFELHQNNLVDYNNAPILSVAAFWLSSVILPALSIKNKQSSNSKIRYKSMILEIVSNKLVILVMTISIALSFFVVSQVNLPLFQAIIVYFFFSALSLIFIFLAFLPSINILSEVTINTSQKTNNAKKITIIIYSIFCLSSVFFLLRNIPDLLNINLIKSSLIFTSIYLLIIRLLSLNINNPLIHEIDNLIEGLIFQTIDVDEALNKYKLITLGAELKELVTPEIKAYLEASNTIKEITNTIVNRLNKYKMSNEEEKKIIDESLGLHAIKLKEAVINYDRKLNILNKKLSYLQYFEGENLELKEIHESINKEKEHVSGEYDKIIQLLKDVKDK